MKDFRKYSVKDKYALILKFCDKHKRLPSYKATNVNEKKMNLFVVNKKNILQRINKGMHYLPIPEWEQIELQKIEAFRESDYEKLIKILTFCETHKKLPYYKSGNKSEITLSKKYISVKRKRKCNQLSGEDNKIFDKIISYQYTHKKPRIEKMGELLNFCIEYKRTPKQHVRNQCEKRLAEFLSTLQQIIRKNKKITTEEKKLLSKVLKYKPTNKYEKSL